MKAERLEARRPKGVPVVYAPDARRCRALGVRTGRACAILARHLGAPTVVRTQCRSTRRSMWETHTTRNPMLLFRLSGSLLLRYVARALS